MMKTKFYLLSGSLLLLAACSSTKPQAPSDWREQRDWKNFEASGRLGVQIKEKGQYANFDWIRENGVETIDINTPIGTTVGQLCQDAEGVLAVDAKGKTYQADNAAELSGQLLGYELPVQYLTVWANGEWVKDAARTVLPDGTLQQYGWNIRRSLKEDGTPHSLSLENAQMTIRMVFSESRREAGLPETQGRCEARQSR
ncbi:MAG: outer membrane lipoprotein LolB [Conchiformibius sp.]|nr:outer membrane lipoprotein LolB [Conchiformibius sp.]